MTYLHTGFSSPNNFEGLKLNRLEIFGLRKEPKRISIGSFSYNNVTLVAELTELDQDMTKEWEVQLTYD